LINGLLLVNSDLQTNDLMTDRRNTVPDYYLLDIHYILVSLNIASSPLIPNSLLQGTLTIIINITWIVVLITAFLTIVLNMLYRVNRPSQSQITSADTVNRLTGRIVWRHAGSYLYHGYWLRTAHRVYAAADWTLWSTRAFSSTHRKSCWFGYRLIRWRHEHSFTRAAETEAENVGQCWYCGDMTCGPSDVGLVEVVQNGSCCRRNCLTPILHSFLCKQTTMHVKLCEQSQWTVVNVYSNQEGVMCNTQHWSHLLLISSTE